MSLLGFRTKDNVEAVGESAGLPFKLRCFGGHTELYLKQLYPVYAHVYEKLEVWEGLGDDASERTAWTELNEALEAEKERQPEPTINWEERIKLFRRKWNSD